MLTIQQIKDEGELKGNELVSTAITIFQQRNSYLCIIHKNKTTSGSKTLCTKAQKKKSQLSFSLVRKGYEVIF